MTEEYLPKLQTGMEILVEHKNGLEPYRWLITKPIKTLFEAIAKGTGLLFFEDMISELYRATELIELEQIKELAKITDPSLMGNTLAKAIKKYRKEEGPAEPIKIEVAATKPRRVSEIPVGYEIRYEDANGIVIDVTPELLSMLEIIEDETGLNVNDLLEELRPYFFGTREPEALVTLVTFDNFMRRVKTDPERLAEQIAKEILTPELKG